MGRDNEDKKKGCCLGGCFWMILWTAICFSAGWLVCNLENNNWDYNTAKDDSKKKIQKHLDNLGNNLPDFGKWLKSDSVKEKESKDIPDVPGVENWQEQADEASDKAAALLNQARKTAGAERERFIRMAKLEIKNALDNYIKAEQVDTGNQVLTEKIARMSRTLEQLGGADR